MSLIKFIRESKKLILILFSFSILFPTQINYSLFASGFKKAVFITGHPTNSNELYVVEQRGMVWNISDGKKNKEPFLDF